jgi:hypothetical protein
MSHFLLITFLVSFHLRLYICSCFFGNLALHYSGKIRIRLNINCLTVKNLLISFLLRIFNGFDALGTQDEEPLKNYTLRKGTFTFEIAMRLINSSDDRYSDILRELHLLAVNCVAYLDLLCKHKGGILLLDLCFRPLRRLLKSLLHVVVGALAIVCELQSPVVVVLDIAKPIVEVITKSFIGFYDLREHLALWSAWLGLPCALPARPQAALVI